MNAAHNICRKSYVVCCIRRSKTPSINNDKLLLFIFNKIIRQIIDCQVLEKMKIETQDII